MKLSFIKNKKILLIIFVLFLNLLLVSPVSAAANTGTNYVPLINVPGVNADAGVLTYLSGLYNFLISVVGILAMAVIIYGGMRYLTSAGNPSSVEEAKDAITSAVTGLILALVSWLILSTINPDILVLKSVGVSGAGTYSYADTQNACVANATGTGTAANPCVCIDEKKVYAKSGATLTPTVLTLTVSPNPGSTTAPGNNITLSGKLTNSAGVGVAGSIKINKVNTALNASTTFNATSGADGTFSTSFTATCAVADQIQAVYAGDATYAGSSGSVVALTINGMTVCTAANYASSPATATITGAGGGSACQSICSDTTLANDNAFHCMKADVRVGWAPITGYTMPDAARKIANSPGLDASPFTATQGQRYAFNMQDYSNIGINTPVHYYFDMGKGAGGKPDGVCDPANDIELSDSSGNPAGWMFWQPDFATLMASPICQASSTPKGLDCAQKFCIVDSKGNLAETTLYYILLDDPNVTPNLP